MKRYHFPDRQTIEAGFYHLWHCLKRLPMGIVVVSLFLLVSFSVAAGYLVNNGLPDKVEKAYFFRGTVPVVNPDISVVLSPKSTAQRYAISLGAYVLRQHFENEKTLAEHLGQPFHVVIRDRRVTLTRLFLGTYPREQAAAELARMKKISPDAFLIQNVENQTASLYGGSFFYPSDAEKQEKLFARQGVKVVKVPTRLTLPMYSACMGDFDTRAEAAEFARSAGLSGIETWVMPLI